MRSADMHFMISPDHKSSLDTEASGKSLVSINMHMPCREVTMDLTCMCHAMLTKPIPVRHTQLTSQRRLCCGTA